MAQAPIDRPLRPSRRHPRNAGLDPEPRPAASARNRAGAHRRAALHPVRRAGGGALAGRAARPRRHSQRAAVAYRLHHHRARSRRRAASLVLCDDDAQWPHLQGRRAASRSRTTKRSRRSISERGMDSSRAAQASRRRPSCRSRTCRSTTASRTPCRASRSRSSAACSRSSAATAWARRRSATRSSASCQSAQARSASKGASSSALEPHQIARAGVGYVPQGRRLWPSLSVDETLRLSARASGAWTVERVYSTFPRLAERRTNGGGQLSGGEQQMLAIARALLGNPRLLVMDEPTEGLAPMIVGQVRDLLIRLAHEEDIAILVVEQNIGVATSVSDHVAIMVNGRVNRIMDASALAADRDLQQRLLGVGRHGQDETDAAPPSRRLRRRPCPPKSGVSRRAAAMRRTTAKRRSIAPIICRTAGACARPPRRARRGPQPRVTRAAPAPALPLRGAHRPHGARRRHLRHQGRRTALHPRSASRLRRPDAHGRPVDVGQAVARRRHPAAGRGDAPERLGRRLQRRSRRLGRGDGGGVRALDRPRTRDRRRHLRRRVGRHVARDRGHAAPAARRSEGHGLDRRVRPGRVLMSAPPTS